MSLWKGIRFFTSNLVSFSALGFHLRKRRWHALTPNFRQQVWLVTGASGGIGASIAEQAALAGARVIAVARSKDKLNALKARVSRKIAQRNGSKGINTPHGEIIIATVDLSNLHAITALTDKLYQRTRIDVLVNNVGILNNDHSVNPQQFEMSYAVNLLGPYYLTERLLSDGTLARSGLILSMSSGGLYNQALNVDMLDQHVDQFDGLMAYASHKRAQISLTDHWRRQHGDEEIFSYVMHPGWVRTEGVSSSLPLFNIVLKPLLRTPLQGADTAIWLAQMRPATRENVVWFDRKQRSPYQFRDTRHPRASLQDLLAFLNRDLEAAGVHRNRTMS